VKKVFDLRSDIETVKFGRPPPVLRFGIEIERIPVFKDEDYSPESLTLRSKQYTSRNVEDLIAIYEHILLESTPALKAILNNLLKNPNEGVLFHCTAGKDRTGVLSGVLLRLAGVINEAIADEYALSRIGMEPKREDTVRKLIILDDYAGDLPGLLWSLDSRAESMSAFLEFLDSKYGGAEGFLRSHVGLSDNDIDTIRENILVAADEAESI